MLTPRLPGTQALCTRERYNARLRLRRYMDTSKLEREVKLRFSSPAEARDAVVQTGATPLRGRRLQEDCLVDTDDGQLRARGAVLRVRVECGKSRITYKGPPLPSEAMIREELETVVGDGEILLRILGELGYQPWFRYQKYREEFAHEDVVVAVDETPVGTFVELEGSEEGIGAMAHMLGRSPAEYVLDSYRTLFVTWQRDQQIPGRDMVFDEV
jgi:adenylate cyclase, class 2